MKKRPFALRLLILEAALLTGRSWGRVGVVADNPQLYHDLHTTPPLWLYVSISSIWGIIFSLLTIALWRRHLWSWRVFWPVLLIYSLFSTGWFAVFAANPYDHQRFAFLVVLAGLGLILNLVLLRRPKVRRAFQKSTDVGEINL
ncbi:MAG: hypothetical protein F9K46_13945 [Anaerolineae bacterium]|nr:MAG: hypothetical protein F9K46_13945 [Anaerolineae bacterium]